MYKVGQIWEHIDGRSAIRIINVIEDKVIYVVIKTFENRLNTIWSLGNISIPIKLADKWWVRSKTKYQDTRPQWF